MWMIELAFVKALRTWPEGPRLENLRAFYLSLDDYMLTEHEAEVLNRVDAFLEDARQRKGVSGRELALEAADVLAEGQPIREQLLAKMQQRSARMDAMLGLDRPVLGPPPPNFAEWLWQTQARMGIAERVGVALGLLFGGSALVLSLIGGYDWMSAGVGAFLGFLVVYAPVAGTGIERYGYGVAAGLLNAISILGGFWFLAWGIRSSLGALGFIVVPIGLLAITGANIAVIGWLARAGKSSADTELT